MTGSKVYLVDTSRSPFAALKPIPLNAVKLTDSLWQPMLQKLREVTLPTQYKQMEITGRIENFRRAADKKAGGFQGYFFNDSDVYKWMEAAAWLLADGENIPLKTLLDELIDLAARAQQPDGYLNTYFTLEKPHARWTDLSLMHELYCAGHLIQAAIAYKRATGKNGLMEVALRLADHVCDTFGDAEGQKPGTGGHQEIEMALVELFRQTGEKRYLQQAVYFLDARGKGYAGGSEYLQDHKPFRELTRMLGHAVRMAYMNAGGADIYVETGEQALLDTLEHLWHVMAWHQVYISGGLGSHHQYESFGRDYLLPAERAYAETCAAIASVMWNWRMLNLTGESRYADLMEITLYNAVLPGLGLDGKSYFYQNPLADDGSCRRQAYYECACCPPNIARILASLGAYFYSLSEDAVWVHFYAEGSTGLQLLDGREVGIEQQTSYPWDGEIDIVVHGEGEFGLNLRIPAYIEEEVQVMVNEQSAAVASPGAYVQLKRAWAQGDRVRIDLPFSPRWMESHPYAAEYTGKVALMRGPILYCLEGMDHPGIDLRDLHVLVDEVPQAAYLPDLLGGVVCLEGVGMVSAPGLAWEGKLYRTLTGRNQDNGKKVKFRAVPYFRWANRQAGQMLVWLRKW